MKKNYFKSLIAMFLLLLVLAKSEAQTLQRESIASNGSSAQTDGVLIRQIVGQPYGTTGYYGSDATFRPGFQQFSNIALEYAALPAEIRLNVYPNPVAESVIVESKFNIENATIQVSDLKGSIILYESVSALRKHVVKCNEWQSGVYILSIHNKNQKIFSSKIIKTE